ncbi:MAG: hypothetical protein Q9163_006144 [Psora crenata]
MAGQPQMVVFDGQPPNGGIPPGRVLRAAPNAVSQAPSDGNPPTVVEIYAPGSTHMHYHLHEVSPANGATSSSTANGVTSSSSDTGASSPSSDTGALPNAAEADAHIHWVNDGARPCDSYPNAAPEFKYTRRVVPKSTTIQELMWHLGCPQRAGCGLQQIFKMEGHVYGPGIVWKYGDGDALMTLEECEIGRGVAGRETVLVAWVADQGVAQGKV